MANFTNIALEMNTGTQGSPVWTAVTGEIRWSDQGTQATTGSAAWPPMLQPSSPTVVAYTYCFTSDSTGFGVPGGATPGAFAKPGRGREQHRNRDQGDQRQAPIHVSHNSDDSDNHDQVAKYVGDTGRQQLIQGVDIRSQARDDATHRIAGAIISKSKVKLEYTVGTMIEVPRAAILGDEIAEIAEFFSFGTNDLTQMGMGLSRDDAGRFLPDYVDERKAGIFSNDPFQSLDVHGVGKLMQWCIERGRATRPKLKIGICGEHGGQPDSIKFCHELGLNYVSCSGPRVPVARLAAAHAKLGEAKDKSL